MKKVVIFLFIMLFSCCLYSQAQSSYTEVVYLKNGSIIKGVIVEQVPNASLKIKTNDGSLFVFEMSEVEKITKEANVYPRETYRAKRQARNTLKGYKGFVDAGYIFDIDDNTYGYGNANRLEISTSHGYQFNNYLFLGGGIAINYYNDQDATSVPIFSNFRANFINKKVTPFADFKIGYSAGDISGVYGSLAIGVRIAVSRKAALNFLLKYSCQEYDGYVNEYYWRSNSYYTYYYEAEAHNGIGLKIGFEF